MTPDQKDQIMSNGTQPSYSHGASGTALLGETIGENLRRMAATFPDSEAVVDVPTGRRAPQSPSAAPAAA